MSSELKKNKHFSSLGDKYSEIMKLTPFVFVTTVQNSSDLRQPSLLKEINSITTYEVVFGKKENNA